jgi:homocysteine S-methyltransferase
LHPHFVLPLLKSLNGGRLIDDDQIPLVVYPNSGETYNVETGWQGKPFCTPLENYVTEWIEHGACFIGGCCRTGASDIKQIRQKIDSIVDRSNASYKNCQIM